MAKQTEKYNPKNFETKWQDLWGKEGIFHAKNEYDKEKFYALV